MGNPVLTQKGTPAFAFPTGFLISRAIWQHGTGWATQAWRGPEAGSRVDPSEPQFPRLQGGAVTSALVGGRALSLLLMPVGPLVMRFPSSPLSQTRLILRLSAGASPLLRAPPWAP